MEIFFLRHFESIKNTSNRLSGSGHESLTEQGRLDCMNFSHIFRDFCLNEHLILDEINAADSARAKETAGILAEVMNVHKVFFHSALISTNAGKLSGCSSEEIRSLDPFFYKNYYLYRKGLLNSYYFDKFWENQTKELKSDFEKRVINCFMQIIERNRELNINVSLIVLHRASLTAILIYVARSLGLYPKDFYGNIESNPGRLSWLTYNNGHWSINLINSSASEASRWKEYYSGPV